MSRKILKLSLPFLVGVISYASCSTKTYMGRWLKWRASDIKDFQKFPHYDFNASAKPFHFFNNPDNKYDSIRVTKKGQEKLSLPEILKTTQTTAFIVIKNDTVVYEKYLNGYTRESINTSFSTAKSISSLMLGVAIDEELIKSENDPVTNYIPELKHTDPRYDSLKISYLLDMRSGIQFKDHDLPWGDKPKAYYHPQLRIRIKELPIKFAPGSKFQYNSYNPILAGMVLEKATELSPSKYFEQKIWNELGMEYSGSWSMDSEKSGMTKMESGLNLRAIDFAKFGRLILNRGNWNGKQVVSKNWVEECSKILPEHNVKEFGNEIFYENFWWLYSKDKHTPYIISGWGHLGQYLYMFPEKKIIIVRMGKKSGSVDSWGTIFKELAGYK